MAVDMRARYFGEFDEGAMPPSFSVYPQYELPNSDFMVMPPAAAQAPAQQYLPAVQPMTQEAAAPYDLSGLDLSGLDSLYGMNFGTDFGGGAMGGIYPDDPNTEFIAAPLSNKGNATSQTGGNAFEVRVDQPVRLVDHSTNQVVFEGTGYDAARKATELGQGLSDTLGRKANYSIQTADPTGNYSTVAYEKKNKSTLGEIANVAGTVLPLAMMAIPGVNAALLGTKLAATTAGQIAMGALTGAASSGLKGQNVLKGAALGGLTAAGGALIPKIPAIGDLGNLARPIGTGIGATAGGLATGQSLKNSLLGGVASGALAYAAPSIQGAIKGIGQGPNLSTGSAPSATPSGPAPIATVTANTGFSPPVSFGGGSSPQTKVAELEPPATIVSGSGSPFAAAFPIPSNVLSMAQPTPKSAADKMAEEELIKVTGERFGAVSPNVVIPDSGLSPEVLRAVNGPEAAPNAIDQTAAGENDLIKVTGERFGAVSPNVVIPTSDARGPLSSVVDGMDTTTGEIVAEGNRFRTVTPNVVIPDSALSPEVLRAINKPAEEPLIKVTGRQTTTPPVLWGVDKPLPDLSKTDAEAEAEKKKKLSVADALALLKLADGLIGGGGGGGGGGAAGSQAINPIFSAKLPTPGAGGAFKVGGLDYTTPPARSAADMYRYAMGPAMDIPAGMDLRGATSPYAGYGPGTLGEETFRRVAEGGAFAMPDQLRTPGPITTPIPNEPAGPSMYAPDVDNMRFAQGGAFAAKRGGSSRDSFAVDGPGTGRSDDIPAVLSDGEYVIDAETVALLGDGSSKAGAKKLDEMRVKVRKHKGRNLAKGKFSVNAKRPEKYLSGGRT
jgi:hypothetical protein